MLHSIALTAYPNPKPKPNAVRVKLLESRVWGNASKSPNVKQLLCISTLDHPRHHANDQTTTDYYHQRAVSSVMPHF